MAKRTLDIIFSEKGSAKVIAAFTQINKESDRLNKILQSQYEIQKLCNTETAKTPRNIDKITDSASKHNKVMAQMVQFWIAWNVAQTVWNQTGAKLIGFMRESIKVASDMNEAYNLVKVTFGGLITEVDTWASHTSAALTQTRMHAKTELAQLQMLFQGVGISQGRAFEMSKTMVERAADISSLRNISPEDAFEAVRRALLNQPRLLRAVGVPITGVTGQADIQTKTLEMYNRVLEKTAIDQGDVVRTAGEWENVMRTLTKRITDYKQAFGDIAVHNKEIASQMQILGTNIGIVTDQLQNNVGWWGVLANAAAHALMVINATLAKKSMDNAAVGFQQESQREGYVKQRNGLLGINMPWEGSTEGISIEDWGRLDPHTRKLMSPRLESIYQSYDAANKAEGAALMSPLLPDMTMAPSYPGMQTIPPGPGKGPSASKLKAERAKRLSMARQFAKAKNFGYAQFAPMMFKAMGIQAGVGAQGFFDMMLAAKAGQGMFIPPIDLSEGVTASVWSGMPGYSMGTGWTMGETNLGPVPLPAGAYNRAFDDQFAYAQQGFPGQMGRFGPIAHRIGMAIQHRARGLSPGRLMAASRKMGNWWDVAQGYESGGIGGAFSTAAGIGGGALTAGMGGILGAAGGPIFALAAGLIGGLFHKKKQDVGLSPANPIYTRDVGVMEVLSQLLNVTKGQLIGGTGAGIDRMAGQLRLQGARA